MFYKHHYGSLSPAENSSIPPLVTNNSTYLHELRIKHEIFNHGRNQFSSQNVTFPHIFRDLVIIYTMKAVIT